MHGLSVNLIFICCRRLCKRRHFHSLKEEECRAAKKSIQPRFIGQGKPFTYVRERSMFFNV